ncbi:MAG: ABC transporter ATP-binding protein [Chlamydiales bacterium]|nr:ABC transporter ATP-binding protein [Chlamydiales bacterium]
MERKTLLHATTISKSFFEPKEQRLFSHVSLEVKECDTIAIMGASGEGKSTLLHILGTLEYATSGSLKIAGKIVSKRNAPQIRNTHIGFVFQSFHLLEDYTVLENILMPAKIAKNDTRAGSSTYKRAFSLLEDVGLSSKAYSSSKLLSGGEKQRIAIARALCNNPELILADEPSGNLDHANSEHIHELLLNLAKKHNKGVIVVTHDLELAGLCDRTYVLQNQQLQLKGTNNACSL